MVYIIGISSGAFGLVEPGEKPTLITIPRKIFAGGLEGVNFTQVDLESITEFNEPNIEEEVKKIKSLGITFGFHGEFYRGAERPLEMLDSAIEADYIHSHERLVQHIKGCGKLGGVYVNAHPSQTVPFIKLGMHTQPTKLVDFWGRPLKKFLEDNKDLLDWIVKEDKPGDKSFVWEFTHRTATQIIKMYEDSLLDTYYYRNQGKEPPEDEKKKIHEKAIEKAKEAFLSEISANDLSYGPEKAAYYIIAKWMQEHDDPLWKSIVGKHIKDEDFSKSDKTKEWVPAVSAKYIWGHFCSKEKQYEDPRPLLKKYNLCFVFEAEMGEGGLEGMHRFFRPRDMILLCQAIKSEYVGVCFDFEHVLSQNINIENEIKSIDYGSAKYIRLCHLGFPTSLVPAHMPIPLGSKEQLWLYERLFELRKKGFKDGWLIFERSGAPRENVIIVLRLIKQFLEKDVPPKDLPLEFYGMKPQGPEMARQELAIKEHALEPLRGMLAIQEEEFTFLSKAAVEKGKAEEWRKEKYR
jgi:endonuclease IV